MSCDAQQEKKTHEGPTLKIQFYQSWIKKNVCKFDTLMY